MIRKKLKITPKTTDEKFDSIYPKPIQALAFDHFTPVSVAQKAAQFLVKNAQTKVLDIGSGVGKFCLVGANCTEGQFTGVEIREALHLIATQTAAHYPVAKVNYIHSNITEIDFGNYHAFYFYNAFFEYIMSTDRIDESIDLTKRLYDSYSLIVKEKLAAMPMGTRLVTYYSAQDEIPASYRALFRDEVQKITMWEKVG